MSANKLKVNFDKTHILMIANSSGRAVQGQVAMARRLAFTLMASNESINESNSEVLLGATIHHSGNLAAIVWDGKTSLRCQLQNPSECTEKDLSKCGPADQKDGGRRTHNVQATGGFL